MLRLLSLVALFGSLLNVAPIGAETLSASAPRAIPSLHPRLRAQQSVSQLQLPLRAFAPAAVTVSQEANNATADQPDHWFRTNHRYPFETLNRIDGYYQQAEWQPAGSSDGAAFFYLGSIYPTAQDAENAWQDGATYSQDYFGQDADSCGDPFPGTCTIVRYTAQGDVVVRYIIFQVGTCTAESALAAPQKLWDQRTDQISTILASVAVAALDTLDAACAAGSNPPPQTLPTTTPTPKPTATPQTIHFSLLGVHIEKYKAKPNPNRKSMATVKSGKVVQFTIYFQVDAAPQAAPFDLNYQLFYKSEKVDDHTVHAKLDPNDPTGLYHLPVGPFRAQLSGKYTFTATLTIAGQTQHAQAVMQVVR